MPWTYAGGTLQSRVGDRGRVETEIYLVFCSINPNIFRIYWNASFAVLLSFKQFYLLANICFPVNKLLTINCAAASLSLLPLLPQLEIVFNEHLCSCDWFFNASVIFHQLQLEIFFGNHLFICKIFLHLLNVAYQLSAVELSRLSNPLKICGGI